MILKVLKYIGLGILLVNTVILIIGGYLAWQKNEEQKKIKRISEKYELLNAAFEKRFEIEFGEAISTDIPQKFRKCDDFLIEFKNALADHQESPQNVKKAEWKGDIVDRFIRNCFKNWHPYLKNLLRHKVIGIYIVKNNSIYEGETHIIPGLASQKYVLFIDEKTIKSAPNECLTKAYAEVLKEEFRDNIYFHLFNVELNKPERLLEYVLLHELGHVIIAEKKLTSKLIAFPEMNCSASALPFEFFIRSETVDSELDKKYQGNYKNLNLREYKKILDNLYISRFPTFYSRTSLDEFLAESFALYYLEEHLYQDSYIEVKEGRETDKYITANKLALPVFDSIFEPDSTDIETY